MPQLNFALMDYIFNIVFFFLLLNYTLTSLFSLDDDILMYNKLLLV